MTIVAEVLVSKIVAEVESSSVVVPLVTPVVIGGGGGGADLSNDLPQSLGTASAGVGSEASRDDHVHAMPTAGDVGALSASSGYNTAGGWLRLDGSGTAPDSTLPASIARDTEVTAAVAAHAGAADPHGDRAYADSLAGNYATAAQGAAADTAVQPGDLATVATTGAYGDLSGRPTLGTAAAAATGDFDAAGAATAAVAAIPADGSAATPSLRTLGTGAAQAAAGNDARLSDARTPAAHAASHEDGGSDEVTLAQSQVTGLVADLAGKAPATRTVGTGLATTGTVNLDLASLHGTIQTVTLTGNPTFTTSNLAAGREVTLILAAGGSGRTIGYPAWIAVGAALPTSLASGKTLVLTITATSTTDASVIAAAAAQP